MVKILTNKALQSAVDSAVSSAVASALSSTTPNDGLWRPRDMGYIAASSDPGQLISNQVAMVSQTQYVTSMRVDQAATITKVSWYQITAGTAITEGTLSLFDSTGAKLCEANVATGLGTVGVNTVTVAAPSRLMVLHETVYAVLRATFTGTAPVLRGPSTNGIPNASGQATGATTRYGTLGTGVTAAPATITPSSIAPVAVGSQCFWIALL